MRIYYRIYLLLIGNICKNYIYVRDIYDLDDNNIDSFITILEIVSTNWKKI